MSLSLKRYQQSPKNQSSIVLTTRNTASKQKNSALNISSSLPRNPQIDIKLPSLSRSSMRKSFSTFQSDRNTKFKLTTLEDKLQQIKVNLHNTRQQTKETLQFSGFLRQTLIQKQLNALQKDLKHQIVGLQNIVRNTSIEQKQRSNQLRDDCNGLWDQTQELKTQLFSLRMKVDALETKMGYKQ